MRREIWLVSDTHFGHANILNFLDDDGKRFRGERFRDVDEMDALMMERWNSRVQPGDIVYHLGDVFIGNYERFERTIRKLNGRKRLVLGNHDDGNYFGRTAFFKKVMAWRMFREFGLVMTHVPLHESSLYRHDCHFINVHGHTHQRNLNSPFHINVSVEQTDYFPVNMEELLDKAKAMKNKTELGRMEE